MLNSIVSGLIQRIEVKRAALCSWFDVEIHLCVCLGGEVDPVNESVERSQIAHVIWAAKNLSVKLSIHNNVS